MSVNIKNCLVTSRANRFLIGMVIITYIVYKIHDFTEPFAYGHARWSDATFY